MNQLHNYLIQPLAPLVFKSGRPFGTGGRDGANFPWPSSVAGMLRTCVMQANGWNYVDDARKQQLLTLKSQGPFLVRISNLSCEIMVPRPLDSVYLLDETTNKMQVCKLAPKPLPAGCYCNLPAGMLPVQLIEQCKGKPQPDPEFWPLTTLLAWQKTGENIDFDSLPKEKPEVDTRTHVAIDSNTYANKAGALFHIQGLDFAPRFDKDKCRFSPVSFALAARFSQELSNRMITLGGKRRLSWLEKAPDTLFACPSDHIAEITKAKGLVMTVVTPAIFKDGWKPGWLDNETLIGTPPECEGLKVKLRAASIGRWQGISGWDMMKQKPKAARKAVPAGSVYWFEIISDAGFDWKKIWLTSICDEQQDRFDGFGQVVPGPWQCKN